MAYAYLHGWPDKRTKFFYNEELRKIDIETPIDLVTYLYGGTILPQRVHSRVISMMPLIMRKLSLYL